MNKKFSTLERYDHLSESELEARLQQEEQLLAETSPSEQLYLWHELRVYQIELETARDRYASLYDYAPIGYLTLDEHGIIRQINLTAARLLGRDSVSIIGYPFVILLDQGDKSRFLNYLKRVYQTPGENLVDEFSLRAAGNYRIDASLTSILIQEQDTGQWVCRTALIDLTRQRRAEAEAEAHRDALAHATRVNKLGELASGAVHELSQPLSAVITYSDVLEKLLNEGGSHEDMSRLAHKISEQAERSLTLLQQLRDFARSRPLKKSYQRLDKLVEEALGLISNKLRNSGIRVVVCADRSLPEVFVDPLQVTQVLINLFSNAVEAQSKHNTKGKIVIDIHPANGPYLQVRVMDSGPGVDPAMADQLFLPFKTTKESGLGIGLSLSRSIIEAHHGKMWADHDVKEGVAFCFTLPTREEGYDD